MAVFHRFIFTLLYNTYITHHCKHICRAGPNCLYHLQYNIISQDDVDLVIYSQQFTLSVIILKLQCTIQ